MAQAVTGFPSLSTQPISSLTASAFSSFVTPAISVPFPSGYGQTQIVLSGSGAAPSGTVRTTIGGTTATPSQGNAATARATNAHEHTSGSSGSGWPTWATAVIAGVGGAIILVAIIWGIFCLRARKRRREGAVGPAYVARAREIKETFGHKVGAFGHMPGRTTPKPTSTYRDVLDEKALAETKAQRLGSMDASPSQRPSHHSGRGSRRASSMGALRESYVASGSDWQKREDGMAAEHRRAARDRDSDVFGSHRGTSRQSQRPHNGSSPHLGQGFDLDDAPRTRSRSHGRQPSSRDLTSANLSAFETDHRGNRSAAGHHREDRRMPRPRSSASLNPPRRPYAGSRDHLLGSPASPAHGSSSQRDSFDDLIARPQIPWDAPPPSRGSSEYGRSAVDALLQSPSRAHTRHYRHSRHSSGDLERDYDHERSRHNGNLSPVLSDA
ncbi:uncharacterized protein L969DRAFT_19031 [Mixia osmundae IAM 14324]|uniref:Uncharacterized protein n=1 Tax=Mixia osmundae (strain CBS 9802 / IAM 14324 / JCM 22182 / KY 12970) TaxID=764103 RepID=G7DS35_MIXOS|nr:uncharacterized protein L969DRAFT_19031 [Mixia osmundae IAM 14324]KEI37550.1 hypothetical protein L969DRAFT_19031 [Mixia osmundae IAM 14324]GAA93395.1 hypothetical protein E5Q_00036 [Mixia osmundae IAM 14324]